MAINLMNVTVIKTSGKNTIVEFTNGAKRAFSGKDARLLSKWAIRESRDLANLELE